MRFVEVAYGLAEIESYLNMAEDYLSRVPANFETWFDEQDKAIPPEDDDDFWDLAVQEHWQYTARFPRILRNSFVLLSLSLFEAGLDDACEWLKRKQGLPISWRESKGSVLNRAKKYFKEAGLSMEFGDQTWQEMTNYYKVRNCIVHRNASLAGYRSDSSLRDYATQKDIVSNDTINTELALTEQFCREVVNNTQTLLGKLSDACQSHPRAVQPPDAQVSSNQSLSL